MQWFRRSNAKALTLPDSVISQSPVTTEGFSSQVEYWTGFGELDQAICLSFRADPNRLFLCQCHSVAIDEPSIIVLRDKTNLLALSLSCHSQPAFRSHSPHLWLCIRPEREAGMSKLLLVEDM